MANQASPNPPTEPAPTPLAAATSPSEAPTAPPKVASGKPTDADLENRFLYHAGTPARNEKHAAVSSLCLVLAKRLREIMPPGRNAALALTHLEDVRMRANAALACDSPSGE